MNRSITMCLALVAMLVGLVACSSGTNTASVPDAIQAPVSTAVDPDPVEDPVPPEVDSCTVHYYTEQPDLGLAVERIPTDLLALVLVHEQNPHPPEIITVDGLRFKDMNRNGVLDPYEDWRLKESCRALDLISQMSLEQRIGLMSEGSRMGNGTADGSLPSSTVANIVDLHRRYSLVRLGSRSAFELAQYHNNVQALAEFQPLAIPVTITADPVHGFGLSTHGTTGARTVNLSSIVSPAVPARHRRH